MEKLQNNRTVRPDAEEIKRMRLEKGWSVEKLANNAICSIKTVENIEKGARVYLSTMSKIATALGVEYKKLLPARERHGTAAWPKGHIQVQILLSIPYDEFDETEHQLGGFIEFLKRRLPGEGDISVIGVTPGSTIITLEMSVGDWVALYRAYSKGELKGTLCGDSCIKVSPIPPEFVGQIKGTPLKNEATSEDSTCAQIEPPRKNSKKHKPDTSP